MPEDKNKRNASPVERRTETADKTVCSLNSLLRSEQRCHRRVGYKNSVSRYHMLVMSKCYETYKNIIDGKYHTGEGKSFPVYEPKYRIVTSTSYKDRIPQTSYVLDIFYPRVVPHMIDTNFACYTNKGVDKARNTFKEYLRKASEEDFVLCADIKNFFGSIDHQKLIKEFLPFIGESNIGFYADVINCNGKEAGLTLGSEINQLSASSFLWRFDMVAVGMGLHIRYMDDIRFIGNRQQCEDILWMLKDFAKSINLELSEKKTYIQPAMKPISFLGFTFLKHKGGRITAKRKRDKISHEKRKLRNMKRLGVPIQRVRVHYNSVRASLKTGNRSNVVKMDKYIKKLFSEEFTNENCKNGQSSRSQYEESIFPFITCGRKDRRGNKNRNANP